MTSVRLLDALETTDRLLCRALRDRIKDRFRIPSRLHGNQRQGTLNMTAGLLGLGASDPTDLRL